MPNYRKYLSPEVLSRISRLDLKARLIVEGFISGLHKSPFHGFSVEFAEHREYVPGDDIRHIDWKVYAKADRFYIKRYEEETNLKSYILLDSSESMRYSSNGMSKYEYGCHIAAALTFLLTRQQDAVGLVLFDNEIRKLIPPSSHPSMLKNLIDAVDAVAPGKKTRVAPVFHRLAEEIKRRGMIILISDLFVPVPELLKGLQHFKHRRHDVLLFHVMDPKEISFDFKENTLFKGMEGYPDLLAEPRSLRKAYRSAVQRFITDVRRGSTAFRIDYNLIQTSESLGTALSSYLASRNRGRRGN
ncbi:MAG: DUF58 domain-containing protein [Planctomycetota bacterium]|nr:DUF58 domain-containing protein [Planctomycetota bacterium]